MEYRRLGRTGIQVSPLCLGTMMFGLRTDEAESIEIIHQAHDLGINFVDTADMYAGGESERILGKAVADRRDDFVIATKGSQPMGKGPNDRGGSRLYLTRALESSLKRMSLDYVDVYYLHAPDYATPIDETLRAMDDMVRSGKTRYIACSNVRAWRLCEALWASERQQLERFSCVQPLYNLVNRDVEVELLPLCKEHGIGVVSYSPLARGILTGKYRAGETPADGTRASHQDARMLQAEWRDSSLEISQEVRQYAESKGWRPSQFALAWVLANPTLTSVIVGPRTREQFADNVACLDVSLTAEDEAFVDALVPPGEHSGKGFQDTAYPITGRV